MSARNKKSGARKSSGPAVPLSDSLQQCVQLLSFMSTKPNAAAFLEPVDWQLYGLHDYPEIITHPMDLGTVGTKLEEGKYRDINAFAADVKLVWDNACKYNRPDSDIYINAEQLGRLFDKKFQKIRESTPASEGGTGGATKSASSSSSSNSAVKKSTKSDSASTSSSRTGSVESTRADRLKFSQLVNHLTPEQLGQLVEMIQNDCPEALNEEDDEEIEIEINNIDADCLAKLMAFANSCVVTDGSANKKLKTK